MGEVNVDTIDTEMVAAEENVVIHEGSSHARHLLKHMKIAVHIWVAAFRFNNDLAAVIVLLKPAAEDLLGVLYAAPPAIEPRSVYVISADADIVIKHFVDLSLILERGGRSAKAYI